MIYSLRYADNTIEAEGFEPEFAGNVLEFTVPAQDWKPVNRAMSVEGNLESYYLCEDKDIVGKYELKSLSYGAKDESRDLFVTFKLETKN